MTNIKDRLYVLFVILLFSFSSNVWAKQDTEFLSESSHLFWFDIDDLPTVQLAFTEQNWTQLLYSTKSNPYEVSSNFTFIKDGTEYELENIGVKLSGNTSFVLPESTNGDYRQAHFSLDFDEFVDDQTLKDLSELRLKRFHNDATFVREPLANQIMHNFDVFTAHSSTYARLEIKIGEQAPHYWGLYRMNEKVNRKEYLDKRFGDNNNGGYLWQGNYKTYGPAHFSRIYENWDGISDSDSASFEYKSKGSKFEQAKQQLVELATNFTDLEGQAFETYIDQHINIPLFLKGLASEAILGHWDGFWGNGNNYYFYIDEQAVLHFIPYDTDNTLGTSLLLGDVGKNDPVDFGNNNSPLLVTKVLAIEKNMEMYKGFIEQLVTQNNLMVESYSVSWINQVHNLISDNLANITNENIEIKDRPASFGNASHYRIFNITTDEQNWYLTRKQAVENSLGKELSVELVDEVTSDEIHKSSGGVMFYSLFVLAIFIINVKRNRNVYKF